MGEIFIILFLVLAVYIAYRTSRKIDYPTTVYGKDNKGENSKKVRWGRCF